MKKTTLLLVLAVLATSALAQEPPPVPGKFADKKAEMITRIQDRIAKEQAALACVQAAQTHEALKACVPEHHR